MTKKRQIQLTIAPTGKFFYNKDCLLMKTNFINYPFGVLLIQS